MKLRNLFARSKPIRTFEELKKCDAKVIGYHEKTGHREGAGSLYQDIISAHILCSLTGKVLACPPVQYLHHHKSAGDSLEIYLKKWEEVFSPLDLHRHAGKYSGRLPFLENPKGILDSLNLELFEAGIKNLRSCFHRNSHDPQKSSSIIAIHLRNENSEDELRGAQAIEYALFNETFNEKLNPKSNLARLIRVQHYLQKEKDRLFKNAQTLEIAIISQGNLPGIGALEKLMPVNYYLDEHPVLSFKRMLQSELLIIGQSSFSYLASLMRKNLSLSLQRFRHRLPENCLIVEIF